MFSLRRSTPAKPRTPEPNSRMLLGSGVDGGGPPALMVNDSPPGSQPMRPPGTIVPTSKGQVAGPLCSSHALNPFGAPLIVAVARVRVSQDSVPTINVYEPLVVKLDS